MLDIKDPDYGSDNHLELAVSVLMKKLPALRTVILMHSDSWNDRKTGIRRTLRR